MCHVKEGITESLTTEPLWMAMLSLSRICCNEWERLPMGWDPLESRSGGRPRWGCCQSKLLAGRDSVFL